MIVFQVDFIAVQFTKYIWMNFKLCFGFYCHDNVLH